MKKDLIIPAILGLGLYSQSNGATLCNNNIMLLALYVLLEDHQEIERLKRCECMEDRCHSNCNCHNKCF